MVRDQEITNSKLTKLWHSHLTPILPTRNRRYFILSDLHLGDGGRSDDFVSNERVMEMALEHYEAEDYQLILLGDIEEFWQFDLDQIVGHYRSTIYQKIRKFGDERVHRVFGNHDSEWGIKSDPIRNSSPDVSYACEAIVLEDLEGVPGMMLVHGHQGTVYSSKRNWLSRFFVRLYKTVKPVTRGASHLYNRSKTKSRIRRNHEAVFYRWAKQNRKLLICGHTHRAIFASKSYYTHLHDRLKVFEKKIARLDKTHHLHSQYRTRAKFLRREIQEEWIKERQIDPGRRYHDPLPCYFNCGCAIYSDGLTGIELDNDQIRLVKWEKRTGKETYNRGNVSVFLSEIRGDQAGIAGRIEIPA